MSAREHERGQTFVEFALIFVVLLMLTAGVVDVGRAFYQYNAIAAAARYGARFGAVVGGTCSVAYLPPSAADWCNQGSYPGGPAPSASCSTPPALSAGVLKAFWLSSGNWPCQADNNTACPTTYDRSFSGYYTVGDFVGSGQPSIVSAIATRFDTDANSGPTSFISSGSRTPGFDLSKMKACIQMSWYQDQWNSTPGSRVTVTVYYPFSAVGPLFSRASFDLVASSTYTIE